MIAQEGVQSFTLEAVAAHAGVSKGGLLYHFPSKEALITGMIDHYIEQFEQRLATYLPGSDADPKAWMRAYVLASLQPPPDEFDISAGLMAAIAINPDLLVPLRQRYQHWQAALDRFPDEQVILLVRFAIDGWWISSMFNLAPPSEAGRSALKASLLALIEEGM